jgi:hypothetical protein
MTGTSATQAGFACAAPLVPSEPLKSVFRIAVQTDEIVSFRDTVPLRNHLIARPMPGFIGRL